MSLPEHYKLAPSVLLCLALYALRGPCHLSNAQMVVLYERPEEPPPPAPVNHSARLGALELGFPKVSLRLRGQVYTWELR